MDGDLRQIPLAQIDIGDAEIQSRAAISPETADEYAEAFRDGREFPPIVLFEEPRPKDSRFRYHIADGWHRILGAFRAGRNRVEAIVRPGTRRDALIFACSANAEHGLKRSNSDKRRAAELMLRDREWGRRSDSDIAQHCRVSNHLVAAVRAELRAQAAETGGVQVGEFQPETRTGKDGKEYPAARRSGSPKGSRIADAALTPTASRPDAPVPDIPTEPEPPPESGPATLAPPPDRPVAPLIVRPELQPGPSGRTMGTRAEPDIPDLAETLIGILRDAERTGALHELPTEDIEAEIVRRGLTPRGMLRPDLLMAWSPATERMAIIGPSLSGGLGLAYWPEPAPADPILPPRPDAAQYGSSRLTARPPLPFVAARLLELIGDSGEALPDDELAVGAEMYRRGFSPLGPLTTAEDSSVLMWHPSSRRLAILGRTRSGRFALVPWPGTDSVRASLTG